MLAPDSVKNIRYVLDQDAHALPVWAVRAIRLLLDERDHLLSGMLVAHSCEEMLRAERRVAAAKQLVEAWHDELERRAGYGQNPASAEYERGYARGVRACIFDLRTVLTQDFSSPHG